MTQSVDSSRNTCSTCNTTQAPPALDSTMFKRYNADSTYDVVNSPIIDTRIQSIRPLLPPAILLEELKTTTQIQHFVHCKRNEASDIIQGKDDRLLIVVGPCSIHDPVAAIEYAERLAALVESKKDSLFICMRVYFEKPRTTIGWKGLINDPDLNGTFNINTGLRIARKLMLQINELSIPVACEILDTITPQFICDLISWGAIGARTTESQLHRELVSGLSMPIGFKNGTAGSVKIAIDACIASRAKHCFMGVTNQGLAAIVETRGNQDCHLVLRGSDSGPNYHPKYIAETEATMKQAGVHNAIMIDCSHGNSEKNHKNQIKVVESIVEQVSSGTQSIVGCMIESNLVAGNQKLTLGQKDQLKYGLSITDACVDWDETVKMLEMLETAVQARRLRKQQSTQ